MNKCSLPQFSVKDTDARVWEWLSKELVNINLSTLNNRPNEDLGTQIEVLNRAMDASKDRESRALNLYLENHIDKIIYINIKNNCQQEQLELQKRIETIKHDMEKDELGEKIHLLGDIVARIRSDDFITIEEKVAIVEMLKVSVILYIENGNKMAIVKSKTLIKEDCISIYPEQLILL